MKYTYITLNKPIGYSSEPALTPSIYELLDIHHCTSSDYQPIPEDLYTVHPLILDAEGLVILTDDPAFHTLQSIPAEYEITINAYLSKQAVHILTKGVYTETHAHPGITLIEEKHKGKRSVVQISCDEIVNRDITTMFYTLGYQVISVRRTKIFDQKLGVLSIGKWKYISKENILPS